MEKSCLRSSILNWDAVEYAHSYLEESGGNGKSPGVANLMDLLLDECFYCYDRKVGKLVQIKDIKTARIVYVVESGYHDSSCVNHHGVFFSKARAEAKMVEVANGKEYQHRDWLNIEEVELDEEE